MEVFYYTCPVCGCVHQTPAYWMGYAAEDTLEQMHLDPKTGAVCENQTLTYSGEGTEE